MIIFYVNKVTRGQKVTRKKVLQVSSVLIAVDDNIDTRVPVWQHTRLGMDRAIECGIITENI